MLVTVTGSALSVEAYAAPNPVCFAGYVQLQAATMGGSSNYVYSWTSDPPGFYSYSPYPVVYPDVNTTYFVQVNDGYNLVTDSVEVVVKALPAQAGKPSGPDTVDLYYVTNSIYSTTGAADATTYQWELLPVGAGVVSGTDTSANVNWNSSFLGEASIHIRGINGCGGGFWSEFKPVYLENTGTTGIQGPATKEVTIFPNPAHDRFRIRMDGIKTMINISVLNVFGENICNKKLQDKDSFVDIEAVPGIYFVIIQSGEQIIIKKLVIQ
jgi:hypothetical protein